jgi:hypothetical protein
MMTEHGDGQSFEESGVKRTFDGIPRELRQYTNRELVMLIMWQRRDPSIIARYSQEVLDRYTSAARAILRERNGPRGFGN